MIDKKQIVRELEEKFENSKKEIGFQTSLDELDSIFFIKDSVLSNGFVSDNFSRQMCARIADVYGNWINYLNNLLISNPNFLVFQTEYKLFSSEEDRKFLWSLIKGAMKFTSLNNLISANRNKLLEKDFIDESYHFWKDSFGGSIEKITQKIYNAWRKD